MIKGLVFDLDGVIIDSEPIQIELSLQVLKDVGADARYEEFYDFVGVRNEEMWDTLIERHGLNNTVDELMERQKVYLYKRFFEGKLEAIDGTPELIRSAKSMGLKIALATSSARFYAEHVLKSVGLYSFFNELVTADDISKSKPDPEIYLKAAKKLGLRPEDCIAVEDAFHGIKAAKGAGMKCIAYKNLNSGNQDTTYADFVVSSIRDIKLDEL